MKKEWKKILQDWQRKTRLVKINKTNLPSMLKICWVDAFKTPNAIRMFKATGLWPFSMKVMEKPEFKQSEPLNTRPMNTLSNIVPASNEENDQANTRASASATGLELQNQDKDKQQEPNFPSNNSEGVLLDKQNTPVSSGTKQFTRSKPSTSSAESSVDMKDAFLEFFKSTPPPSNPKRKNTQIRLVQYGECVTDSDMLERLRKKEKLEKLTKKKKLEKEEEKRKSPEKNNKA